MLFEQEHSPGGRVQTVRIGEFVFDSGATSIAPRGKAIEHCLLSELGHDDLVPISKPIYTHAFGRITPGDAAKNSTERFCYVTGIQTFAVRLAEGSDIRYGAQLSELAARSPDGPYSIAHEEFDKLIVTTPTPVSQALLASIGVIRPFANARYRTCLSVLLGFAHDLGERPYHALIDPEQRNPLTWLSIESLKCSGRAPSGSTAMVAQLGVQYSIEHFDAPDPVIVKEATTGISRLFGPTFADPVVASVVRWRHSQPETTALFSSVNPHRTNVYIAGDGVLGGRVELAFESGIMAARKLLEESK